MNHHRPRTTLRRRAGLLTLACLLGLSAPAAAASLIELTPEAKADGAFKELGQIETILRDVAALRQLPVKRPIQVGILDRSQLQAKLEQQIKDEIPVDKLRGEEALYRQLGMLPAGFDYAKFLLELYTEQIGGFYDPKTKELRLIKGVTLTGMDQQMLIAHELTHALQDQHYDLGKYMDPESDNDDRSLAQAALIEGDATVAAMEYLQARASDKPFQGLLELLGSAFNAARQMQGFEKFRSAPAFIKDSLTFPYDQGAQFVNAFRHQGWSWDDVSVLYAQPPSGTEHILHPDTYLDGEKPQAVSFSLKQHLPGSRVLSGSVWGELGYRQLLQQHLGFAAAKPAAQGWHGDRYEVLETPDGIVIGLYSVWDSEADATAFVTAWRNLLKARNAGSLPENGRLSWNGRNLWVRRQGSAVAIVENLSPAQAKSLDKIEAAWKAMAAKPVKPQPVQPVKKPKKT